VREAFDLSREPAAARDRYGKFCESFLLARRLAEAGVSVVTLKVGDWDTHEKNFIDHKDQLPQLDRGFHALVSDLYARGLEKDVAVVLWGRAGSEAPGDRSAPKTGLTFWGSPPAPCARCWSTTRGGAGRPNAGAARPPCRFRTRMAQ